MHPVRGTHPGQQPPRPVHPGGGPGTELTAHPAPQRSALGPRFGLAGQLEVRFLVGRGGEPSPSHTGPGRHPVAFAHDRSVSGGWQRALRGNAGWAAHMMGMTITTADHVRSLIRHSGGTQREFGELIGLDEPTLGRRWVMARCGAGGRASFAVGTAAVSLSLLLTSCSSSSNGAPVPSPGSPGLSRTSSSQPSAAQRTTHPGYDPAFTLKELADKMVVERDIQATPADMKAVVARDTSGKVTYHTPASSSNGWTADTVFLSSGCDVDRVIFVAVNQDGNTYFNQMYRNSYQVSNCQSIHTQSGWTDQWNANDPGGTDPARFVIGSVIPPWQYYADSKLEQAPTPEQLGDEYAHRFNMVITTRASLAARGDKRIDQWTPADPRLRCAYAYEYAYLKYHYNMDSTQQERDKVQSLVGGCTQYDPSAQDYGPPTADASQSGGN